MTIEDINRMAQEAGFPERRAFSDLSDLYPRLERFAELVRDDEREVRSMRWDEYIAKAIAAEREACAQSLDKQADLAPDELDRQWAQEMAAAVRARGEKT